MANLRYNFPSDNVAPAATLSLPSGTADAAYPLANIVDLNPAHPFKLTTTTCRIVFDLGSATTLAIVALIHHNLDAGLNVRWQGNATNSWGSPSFDYAFTITAKDQDGYRPNSVAIPSGSYRYWSLVVVGTNTNNLIFGSIWIGTALRTLTNNYSWGYKREDPRPGAVRWKTRAGVEWVSPTYGRQRRLASDVQTTDAGLVELTTWYQSCGGMDQPTLILPGAQDWTDAGLVKWADDMSFQQAVADNVTVQVSWLEVAKGLPWP
jgi:hypothetical protein